MFVWCATISKVPSHLLSCLILPLTGKAGDVKLFMQMSRASHTEVDFPEMQSSKEQDRMDSLFWLQAQSYLHMGRRWDLSAYALFYRAGIWIWIYED